MDFQRMNRALYLAPMAGITDCSFRQICVEMGCDVTVTEMISADGLVLSNNESHIQRQLMQKAPNEQNVGVQLFGAVEKTMRDAARLVAPNYDFIDINMGCPAPKIIGNHAGAALGRDRGLARLIIKAAQENGRVPVTVKMRLGWDDTHKNYMEMARMCCEEGVAALAVHGRTKVQMFSGKADMTPIAEVVKAVNIPVVANGDIFTPEDALRVFEQTGCAAVMIGRGAMGNPFIFRQIKQLFATGRYDPVCDEEKLQTAMRHTCLLVALKGERVAAAEMRKHIGWYIKGMRGAAAFRERINASSSIPEILDLLKDFVAGGVL